QEKKSLVTQAQFGRRNMRGNTGASHFDAPTILLGLVVLYSKISIQSFLHSICRRFSIRLGGFWGVGGANCEPTTRGFFQRSYRDGTQRRAAEEGNGIVTPNKIGLGETMKLSNEMGSDETRLHDGFDSDMTNFRITVGSNMGTGTKLEILKWIW
ncbi:hypothetical protein U1Q18_028079, partial [Sarracenia purpurea var. burkii]